MTMNRTRIKRMIKMADRGARVFSTLVLIFLAVGPVAASEDEPAALFIESIEVVGLRHLSFEVIVSESLLSEGAAYTEDQLRQAANRINRLPFVLETDFSLRKGTRRSTFVLVITIEETLRFFFGMELQASSETGLSFAESGSDLGDLIRWWIRPPLMRQELDAEEAESILAGVRFSLGRTGVLFAAYNSDRQGIEVGYTRYDLFGRNAFFNIGVSRGFETDLWGAAAELGVPVHGNHSIRAIWDWGRSDWSWGSASGASNRRQRLALRWQFDTRNDTYFATRGKLLFVGIEYFDEASSSRGAARIPLDPASSLIPYDYTVDQDLVAAVASATRYRPISSRSSWWVGGRVAVGQSSAQIAGEVPPWFQPHRLRRWNTLEGEFNLGYLRTIWRPPGSKSLNDLRWRSFATLYGGHFQNRSDLRDITAGRLSLGTSLDFRSRWGVLRFSLIYRAWRSNGPAYLSVPSGALR